MMLSAARCLFVAGQVSSFIGTGPGQGHPAIPKEGAPEKLDTWPSVEFLITPRPRAESEHHSKRGRCVCAVGDSSPDAGRAFGRVEGGSRMKSSLVDAARGTGRRTARHVRPPGESGGRGKDPCTHRDLYPPPRSLSLCPSPSSFFKGVQGQPPRPPLSLRGSRDNQFISALAGSTRRDLPLWSSIKSSAHWRETAHGTWGTHVGRGGG